MGKLITRRSEMLDRRRYMAATRAAFYNKIQYNFAFVLRTVICGIFFSRVVDLVFGGRFFLS